MSILKDSSELKEAFDLFRDFVEEGAPVRYRSMGGADSLQSVDGVVPETAPRVVTAPVVQTQKVVGATPMPVQPLEEVEGEFRGDRLENALIAMCRRGGFKGAVVADDSGLPLAVHNSPVETEEIAAFTAILGDALGKAGRFLHEHGADYISMDINYEEKVVVRSFDVLSLKMYLMVLCPQTMDERAEVELSLQQIASILSA